jgi:hypothetical protein
LGKGGRVVTLFLSVWAEHTQPAGRPARPAATKSAYDDDNVGIDRRVNQS